MSRPTPAAIAFARSTLPVRRVASTGKTAPGFAALLKSVALRSASRPAVPLMKPSAAVLHDVMIPGGPTPMTRSDILANAQKLLDIPYVWGGVHPSGLDCSAFVSQAWGVSRQTTDSLSNVSHPISKDELQAGD